jgi:hypothetical protein
LFHQRQKWLMQLVRLNLSHPGLQTLVQELLDEQALALLARLECRVDCGLSHRAARLQHRSLLAMVQQQPSSLVPSLRPSASQELLQPASYPGTSP